MVKEERDRMRMEIIRPVYDKMPRRGVIRTDEVDGEFRISSSKDAVSAMPCVMITINDIKTLKLVAGNPDEYFKNGTLKHRTPKVVDLADKNIRVENARQGYANNRMVCDVMDAYIYGDSDAVKQNEALLNQIYFPMQVACFGSDEQDIIVTKDNPLIIDARSGTPIRAEFRKVTLEEGGRVKFYGNVDFSAREIDQKGEASDEGSLCSYGSDGGNGADGGNGGNGSKGGSGCGDCDAKAGAKGANGADGSKGESGNNSSSIVGRLGEIKNTITVGSVGGNGGNGGNGGRGGNGGDGGDGIDDKDGKDSGNGGEGGNGGKGGNGGNAGNGADMTLYVESGAEFIRLISKKAKGGDGGQGGDGGNGGMPGKVYDNGIPGTPGDAGAAGDAGTAGAAGNAGKIEIVKESLL